MEEEKKTETFNRKAVEYSRYYKGKISTFPKVPVRTKEDFSYWYTPGIAEVSRDINKNVDLSFELTGRWNTIGIITDGTRVLGIGNVGPEAAMPVMEGKALLFNLLGGVNAIPIPIRAPDKDAFINTALALEPAFGAFNLEDIESPKCFFILKELQEKLKIPAWHDDQLGTACITLAGLYNAMKLVGKKLEDSTISLIGSGAANIAAAFLLIEAGVRPQNIIMCDSKGILNPEREDMDRMMINNPWKYELGIKTNGERRMGDIAEAVKGSDAIISAAKSQPGLLNASHIKSMNNDPIIFALANPLPEIWPDDAKKAGAKIVATGRSDFPNQINNSLVFPAIFRGVLDARAKGVNFKIMVRAAKAIASYIKDPTEDNIVPTMEDWEMYPVVASEVARATVDEKMARKSDSKEGFYKTAYEIIKTNRDNYNRLLNEGVIKKLPGDMNE
ncbi:NAD(P)-dependent malic enzyme [Caldiplasma sukawensis]